MIAEATRRLGEGQSPEAVVAALVAGGAAPAAAQAVVSRIASAQAAEPGLQAGAARAGAGTAFSGVLVLGVGIWNAAAAFGSGVRHGNEMLVLASPLFILVGLGMIVAGLVQRARSRPG